MREEAYLDSSQSQHDSLANISSTAGLRRSLQVQVSHWGLEWCFLLWGMEGRCCASGGASYWRRERFLIRYPCWQLFQRGINYTTANSSLVKTPLSSMSLSWGWFCWSVCYFFLSVVVGFEFFYIFGGFFLGWPGLLAHVPSGSQTGSSSQRCMCSYELLQNYYPSFWPGQISTSLPCRPLSFTFLAGDLGPWAKGHTVHLLPISQLCKLLREMKW